VCRLRKLERANKQSAKGSIVYRKSFVLIIAGLLINLLCPAPIAAQQSAREFRKLARIKAEVASLSTEPQREIIATLSDDTEVKGYVTSFSADRFTVKDTKNWSRDSYFLFRGQAREKEAFNLREGWGVCDCWGRCRRYVLSAEFRAEQM
jgi:hypothetical protein